MKMETRAVALLLPLLAACAAGDAEWAGTVTDSAGVTVVHNPATADWTLRDAPTLTEELRIGALDGAAELQFGQVTAIDVDDDGAIYVLDTQAAAVRVFDRDGRHLRSVGRAGGAPGEFSPTTAAVMAGDNGVVYVADVMRQRIAALDATGTEIGSTPLMMQNGIPVRWEVTPERRFAVQLRAFPMPGTASADSRDHIVLRDPASADADTLLAMPSGQTFDFAQGQAPRMRLFVAEPVWALLSDGRIARATNDNFRIEILARDGTVEWVLTRPFECALVTESDRSTLRDMMREVMLQQGAPPAAVDMFLQGLEFADHYPAFATVLGGPDGSIWVQRIRTPGDNPDGARLDPQDLGSPDWDVFDAEGRGLGTVTLPTGMVPLRFIGNHIYGTLRDDLDVPYVVRVRVEG